MSTYARKNILLIFGGDLTLPSGPPSSQGIKQLLEQFPELGIMASLESVFIPTKKEEELTPHLWIPINQAILDHQDAVDGFVVVVPLESLLEASLATAFSLQGIPKPVLYTGSPTKELADPSPRRDISLHRYQELGIRSNLVGAIHSVTTIPNEVCVFDGNRVMRAVQTSRNQHGTVNMYEPWQSNVMGRADLGVRIFNRSWQRHLKLPTSHNRFASETAFIKIVPNQWEKIIASVVTDDIKAAIYDISHLRQLPGALVDFMATRPDMIHVLYSSHAIDSVHVELPKTVNIFEVVEMTPEAVQMKLAWLLAQMDDPADLPRVKNFMQRNLIGEIDPYPTILR
jgi:L-asparaginase/Glu-tRNA(Gln) amidotransferase subunit D